MSYKKYHLFSGLSREYLKSFDNLHDLYEHVGPSLGDYFVRSTASDGSLHDIGGMHDVYTILEAARPKELKYRVMTAFERIKKRPHLARDLGVTEALVQIAVDVAKYRDLMDDRIKACDSRDWGTVDLLDEEEPQLAENVDNAYEALVAAVDVAQN